MASQLTITGISRAMNALNVRPAAAEFSRYVFFFAQSAMHKRQYCRSGLL